MLASIDVAMGGRAAEELLYGNEEITTGWNKKIKFYDNKLKWLIGCSSDLK